MSIKYKYFCDQLASNMYLILLVFLFLFSMPKSFGQTSETSFNEKKPKYRHKTMYIVYLDNIPIGTAVASTANKKTMIPNETFVQISDRVGSSPISTNIFVQADYESSNHSKNFLIRKKLLSISDRNDLEKSSNNSDNILIDKEEEFSSTYYNIFFNSENNLSLQHSILPIPNDLFHFKNKFDAEYSRNHFLKKATLRLKSGIKLTIKAVNKNYYHRIEKKIRYQRLDLGLLTSPKDEMGDIKRLTRSLSKCQSEMISLNKLILNKMPYESYLLYRRIINLKKLCTSLKNGMISSVENKRDPRNVLSTEIIKLFQDDPIEWPHVMSTFSDRTVYYNQNMSFLWPRVTTLLVNNAINELKNSFQLDLNRKSLLGLRLKIKSLQPRSIVRVDIKQINPSVKFYLRNSSNEPYFVDGAVFGNHSDYDLSEKCKNFAGRVGIDLTEIKPQIITSFDIRGIWDAPTKLKVARSFALKAVSEKSCHKIYFKVNAKLAPFLQQELDIFKKEALSLENNLLLSNYRQKKLWVMPGRYRLIISSISNEKVISVQEFTVKEQTQTNVIANVQ